MKIIREIDTRRVIYMLNDFEPCEITETGMVTPSITALDVKPQTHELIDNVSAPDFYVGGALSWDDDAGWGILNQYAVMADQAAKIAALQTSITTATQARLDTFAQTCSYDGILSACTYAASTVPQFASDGQYCVNARDATWATLYSIMGEVQAGTRPMPSGYADIEADLPVLAWP